MSPGGAATSASIQRLAPEVVGAHEHGRRLRRAIGCLAFQMYRQSRTPIERVASLHSPQGSVSIDSQGAQDWLRAPSANYNIYARTPPRPGKLKGLAGT